LTLSIIIDLVWGCKGQRAVDNLRKAYRDHLIAAGVNQLWAAKVAANLSANDLKVITEIWSTWAETWQTLHRDAT
jgi:hypothetical protein